MMLISDFYPALVLLQFSANCASITRHGNTQYIKVKSQQYQRWQLEYKCTGFTFIPACRLCATVVLPQCCHVTASVWQVCFSQCIVWNSLFIGKCFSGEQPSTALITSFHPNFHGGLTAANSSRLLEKNKTKKLNLSGYYPLL